MMKKSTGAVIGATTILALVTAGTATASGDAGKVSAVAAPTASANSRPVVNPTVAESTEVRNESALESSGPDRVADEAAEDESTEDANEGPDVAIEGPDLDRAIAAAIAYLDQGTVTETEIGDEESLYEVEITLDNGDQVDVQLDETFTVVGTD